MLSNWAPLSRQRNGRSGSTSSVWQRETDLDNYLIGISTMLHCQLLMDVGVEGKISIPAFCLETYSSRASTKIPVLHFILNFFKTLFVMGKFPEECCATCLIYINRLIGACNVRLASNNWQLISIIALLLAQKMWDDNPLNNAGFHLLYPFISVRDINSLERVFLGLIEYQLVVTTYTYTQYSFELRTIAFEKNGQ
jgi:hypothetical protein